MSRAAYLYIDESAACLLLPGSEPTRYADTPDDRQKLTAHLQDHAPVALHVLAHLADEDIQPLKLPPLSRRDRDNFVQRRLVQQFADHPLRCAITPITSDDKAPICCLAALPSAPLTAWLDLAQAAGIPLAGVWSLSQFAAHLLSQLHISDRRGLLIVRNGEQLNEYVFQANAIVFARHAPASLLDTPLELADEVSRLERYLAGQQWLSPNDRLPVHIVQAGSATPCVQLAAEFTSHTLPDSGIWARQCLQELARRPPKQQFAPSAWRATYLRQRKANMLRHALLFLGLALSALGLLFEHLGRPSSAAFPAELSTPSMTAAVSPAPLPNGLTAEELHRLAHAFRLAQASATAMPETTWRPLGAALEHLPGIRLDELKFESGTLEIRGHSDTPGEFEALRAQLLANGQSAEIPAPQGRIAGQTSASRPSEFVLRLRPAPAK